MLVLHHILPPLPWASTPSSWHFSVVWFLLLLGLWDILGRNIPPIFWRLSIQFFTLCSWSSSMPYMICVGWIFRDVWLCLFHHQGINFLLKLKRWRSKLNNLTLFYLQNSQKNSQNLFREIKFFKVKGFLSVGGIVTSYIFDFFELRAVAKTSFLFFVS